MGSNLHIENNYGGFVNKALSPRNGPQTSSQTNEISKTTEKSRKTKRKIKFSETSQEADTDFTPIKNIEARKIVDSPSGGHPMKMRSNLQKRTLNFCEEYLGNLDDYDFTDYDANSAPATRTGSQKKNCTKRQREDTATSSIESQNTSNEFSVKTNCNTELNNDTKTNNQNNENDAKKICETSQETMKNLDTLQIASKLETSRGRKRSISQTSCNKTKKKRKLKQNSTVRSNKSNNEYKNVIDSSHDYAGKMEANTCNGMCDKLHSSFPTVTLQDICSDTDGLTCDYNSLTHNGKQELHKNDTVSQSKMTLSNINVTDSTPVSQCNVNRKSMSFANEEFADSPDSGFVSESSSAASPNCDNSDEFFNIDKDDWKNRTNKKIISRTSSSDSGISKTSTETSLKNAALVLCGKSVKAAEKQKEMEKKRAEDEELRIKYHCKWQNCPDEYSSRSSGDLHNHLVDIHLRSNKSKFCCQWKGCKYFEKAVRKESWLKWHVLDHSGEKPFKCIVNGCDASFVSRHGLERHVNSHYTEVNLPKAKIAGDVGGNKLIIRRRKIQNERKALANLHDCMDNHTLNHIAYSLFAQEDQIFLSESLLGERLAMRPMVIAKKVVMDEALVLVKWHPMNILPNEWIPEANLKKPRTVNRKELFKEKPSSLERLFRNPEPRPAHRRRK